MRSSFVLALLPLLAVSARAADPADMRAATAGVTPEFCTTLKALVAAAPTGFVSLRGKPREIGENTWAGTKRLPGSDCTIFGGTPPSYSCTLYAGDVEENSDGAYDRAVAAAKDCLPDAGKSSEKVNGVHARTTVIEGPKCTIRVVSRDVGADAYMVDLWIDGR